MLEMRRHSTWLRQRPSFLPRKSTVERVQRCRWAEYVCESLSLPRYFTGCRFVNHSERLIHTKCALSGSRGVHRLGGGDGKEVR